MHSVSRLALVAVLTVGTAGIMGFATGFLPTTSAFAARACTSPNCGPTSSSQPPDSSSQPPDTSSQPPDTSSQPPDTSSQPPDTSSQPPDTSSQPPDTSSQPPDTSSQPPDTSSEPPDTSSEPSKPHDGGDDGDDPGGPDLHPILIHDDPRIDCTIKPDEPITRDMWLINKGESILEHDTKVRWRVPSTGQHGAFLIPKDIPVGQERVIRNFLVDTKGGAECRIEIID